MDGGGLELTPSFSDTDDPKKKARTLGEIFDEQAVYYMAIGMTYEDYWYGDVRMGPYYVKAEKERIRKKNQFLHLQGRYVYEAIYDLLPALIPFNKNPDIRPYSSRPLPIFKEEIEEEERLREQERMQEMRRNMSNAFERFNKNFAKRR